MERLPVCHIRTPKFTAILPVQHSHVLMQNLLQLLTAGHVRAPLGSLMAPDDALMYHESNSGLTVQAPGGAPWAIIDCYDACMTPQGALKPMDMPEALALLKAMLDDDKNHAINK